MHRADEYTNEQLDEFIKNNRSSCEGLCEAWGLEILSDAELRQAAEYLLNQI